MKNIWRRGKHFLQMDKYKWREISIYHVFPLPTVSKSSKKIGGGIVALFLKEELWIINSGKLVRKVIFFNPWWKLMEPSNGLQHLPNHLVKGWVEYFN